MRKLSLLIITLLLSSLNISCAYKPDVQQGNTFDKEQLSQLKIGMTQQQVTFIMGTALLKDAFHKNRWDYVYTYTKGRGDTERKLLTLYFKNNRLTKIDDSQIKKVTIK